MITASPTTFQKTFGMELSMNGVDAQLDWVFVNADRARQLYGNQGVHNAAIWIASLHPRALEYLEQAPILALAASFGGKADSKQERAYLAMNLKPLFDRGEKLKTIMKAFHVEFPLRAISATAIRPGVWGVLKAISKHVPASTISQSIPADKSRHATWLGGLAAIFDVLQRRDPNHAANGEVLSWAMKVLPHRAAEIEAARLDEVADFLICNRGDWNGRWSWDRVIRETAAWHEALANANIDRINDGRYDEEVDYGAFPREASYSGFTFHALQSLRALIVEGKAMRHCVASYHRDILSGRARVYSIRKGGDRVATLELNFVTRQNEEGVTTSRSIRVAQIKGPCNAPVAVEVEDAAKWLARDTMIQIRQAKTA